MLRSIGADQVIDYTQADFTKNGETYDVIFDVVGKSSFPRSVRSLKHNGRYLIANPKLSQMVRGRRILRRSSKTVIPYAARAASHERKDEGQKTNQVAYIFDLCPFFVYDLVRLLLDQSEDRDWFLGTRQEIPNTHPRCSIASSAL